MVGRKLAQSLAYWFLDTGIMYRAVTWLALEKGVSPQDSTSLGRLSESVRVLPVSKEGDSVEVEGRRVGPELRESRVDQNVSDVSRHPNVRRAMVEQQREYAQSVAFEDGAPPRNDAGTGIVMIGRDIGTVVLPDAGLKVFLTASAEQRALRRWRETQERGQEGTLAAVQRDIESRDAIDSSREDSPLRPAEDAWPLDTSELAVEEVVDTIIKRVKEG